MDNNRISGDNKNDYDHSFISYLNPREIMMSYTIHQRNPIIRWLVRLLPRSVKTGLKTHLILPLQIWRNLIGNYIKLFLLHKTPIVVFQMGKVGSMSIFTSLKNSGELVIHAHFLDPAEMERISQTGNKLHHSIRLQKFTHQHILNANRPVKFITMVRDPMAVAISGFFTNVDRFTGVDEAYQKLSLDELMDVFLDRISSDYVLIWFDRHLKPALGIDIYDHPFPKEIGHMTIHQGNYDLLLMKAEIPDLVKQQCVAEYLDIPPFKLALHNIGEEQAYAEVYKQFKQNIIIPQAVIDQYYTDRFTRHFYTEEEIARFRQRWERH